MAAVLLNQPAASTRWELYRLLSEPARLRLLALAAAEELTIGELGELLDEPQPNVSRHVAALRRPGLLAVRKQGTRVLVRLGGGAAEDAVVADAIAAGRALVEKDGSLRRVAEVVRARDSAAREFFSRPAKDAGPAGIPAELPAYLTAIAPLIEKRRFAVDAGTGEGGLLDVLAPIFDEVLALDREEAQLTRARARLALRGYDNVTLMRGEMGDDEVLEAVEAKGGADVVFASRVLHHAPRPHEALRALAALTRPGGAVVIIDYEPHEDETMREEQADLWLGFEGDELLRWAREAGLSHARVTPIPDARRGHGPDGALGWQVMIARRPVKAASAARE